MRQTGFTLLEVLVAMVVLSVGLLGLAGLMASSMRNSSGAYHRTQAVWLSYDIADRMRANRQLVPVTNALANNYAFNNLATGAIPASGAPIAQTDLNQWATALAALPEGRGSVVITDAANRRIRIRVQWNDTRASGGISAEFFEIDTQL